MAGTFMSQTTVFLVVLVGCTNLVQAGKCSDHLLSLSMNADGWGDEYASQYDFSACTAVFGTFDIHLPQVHNLINEHIAQSFVYSIMSSHFDTDSENRLGFCKYLDNLADSMWDNAVSLVKYAGARGCNVAPIMDDPSTGLRLSANLNDDIKPWTEIEVLALVQDHHRNLASKIHHLHGSTHDTSFSHFLEKQFVRQHVERIRELAGHMTNVVPMYVSERNMLLMTTDCLEPRNTFFCTMMESMLRRRSIKLIITYCSMLQGKVFLHPRQSLRNTFPCNIPYQEISGSGLAVYLFDQSLA